MRFNTKRIAYSDVILSSFNVYCAGLKVAATVLIELCVSSTCLSSSVITRGFGKFSIVFSCSLAYFLACSSRWCWASGPQSFSAAISESIKALYRYASGTIV